jgi:hypothetical protein
MEADNSIPPTLTFPKFWAYSIKIGDYGLADAVKEFVRNTNFPIYPFHRIGFV